MSDNEYYTDWKNDGEAWRYLKLHGYNCTKQFMIKPPKNHTPTEKENSAIDYLVSEWDWGYKG